MPPKTIGVLVVARARAHPEEIVIGRGALRLERGNERRVPPECGGPLVLHTGQSPVRGSFISLGCALREGRKGIAEQRMIETIQSGKPTTPFLKHGDRVEIEMFDAKKHSIFGRIDQQVVKA